jgi:translation elongation factor EF-Tu-like GTPase
MTSWISISKMEPAVSQPEAAISTSFNVNIGILGHVDSGKTSLAKVLSNVVSTAAFDKNP